MDPTAAVTIWSELLAGQWVVIDRREEAERRTLVLRRASDAERSTNALTELEQEVLAMALRAQPLKVMAAELGRSTSRIAEVLVRVRRKLGAPTHADLLRTFASRSRNADRPVATSPPRASQGPLAFQREKSRKYGPVRVRSHATP